MKTENIHSFLESLTDYSSPRSAEYFSYAKEGYGKRFRIIRNIISTYSEIAGKKILDIGCGTGGIVAGFAEEKNTDVWGVDSNAHYIAALRNFFDQEGVPAHFMQGDAQKLPFSDSTFDIVVCNDVMEHVPSPDLLFSEIHRILKQKGVVFFSTHNRYSPRWFFSDPHFGLFGLTFFHRMIGKFYVTKIRKMTKNYDIWYFLSYAFFHRTGKKLNMHEEFLSKTYYMQSKKKWVRKLFSCMSHRNFFLRMFVPMLVFIFHKK